MSSLHSRMKKYKILASNSLTCFSYYHMPVKKNRLLAISRDGEDAADNILCIISELQKEEYENYTVYLYLQPRVAKAKTQLLRNCGLGHVRVITSRKACMFLMERAQYILSDSSLPWNYVKKPGQTVINTWHGTPFKHMGRSTAHEKHRVGGTQQALLKADYLIYPNAFMKDVMIRDFMLENLSRATCLCSGYPRNDQFCCHESYAEQRARLGLKGQIITYMPTFRSVGFKRKNKDQVDNLRRYFSVLDGLLREDQTFFVKLHNYNLEQLDLTSYKRIKPFPEGHATYDVLAATDILVTDYSSVFFDFANTRRKIILFAYDEEEYFTDRGVYFPFDELPFAKVESAEALFEEIERPNDVDYAAFFEKFGYYDNPESTRSICRHIFRHIPSCKEEPVPYNGKENVLLFGGSLAKNGISSALLHLLAKADKSRYNYIICFLQEQISQEPSRVNIIPEDTPYMPLPDAPSFTFWESKCFKYMLRHDIPMEEVGKKKAQIPARIERAVKREWERLAGHSRIHKALQFDGYGEYAPLLFALSGKPSAIWVHSDHVQEKLVRGYNTLSVLNYCYHTYDKIVLVNDVLQEPVQRFGAPKERITTVYNCYDAESFRQKSLLPMTIDSDTTVCQAFEGSLEQKLKNAHPAFVTIGRFSPEKGYARLLKAFDTFHKAWPESCLLIIGGHGVLFDETVELARSLPSKKDIILIKSLSNPAPFLKACDCFISSSFYEGLPIMLFEAVAVNLPIITTRIPAVERFMESCGGTCVENSEEGILEGMEAFARGEIKALDLDFEAFNENALNAFHHLLDELKA